jgi:hypothetical protein
MPSPTQILLGFVTCAFVVVACKDDELDASGDDPPVAGEACEPVPPPTVADAEDDDEADPVCADNLACEPTDDGYICAAPIEIHGMVIDGLTQAPIEGAVIAALDETGAPVGNSARSDAMGHYVLRVSARRDPEGLLASDVRWTLFSAAVDYATFPGGLRSPIPVDATAPTTMMDEDEHEYTVIENATTTVALLPLAADQRGGITVTGHVGGDVPGGTLVVAEGAAAPAPYTIADSSGAFVLFNVPAGATSIRGYRQGLELVPTTIATSGDVVDIVLEAVTEGVDELARVSGSVNIVNAPGGSLTSVVLVPNSLFDPLLERGPVPLGLRAPSLPEAPSVSNAFSIAGVPSGDYTVLVAFENDFLVRDPDTSIGGTEIQTIAVPTSGSAAVEASFKVTEALSLVGPGAETPEIVTAPPVLTWADDSSEDLYELRVIDALGNVTWEVLDVPRVTGSGNVEVMYAGPSLQPGMYYQFRATSMKDGVPISRTEDLRGVFVFQP